jgi:hypothetical protein
MTKQRRTRRQLFAAGILLLLAAGAYAWYSRQSKPTNKKPVAVCGKINKT